MYPTPFRDSERKFVRDAIEKEGQEKVNSLSHCVKVMEFRHELSKDQRKQDELWNSTLNDRLLHFTEELERLKSGLAKAESEIQEMKRAKLEK